MIQDIEAIFEDGVLRPLEPLKLADHQRVRVTVATERPDMLQLVASQRQAMAELDAELATVPDDSPADDFSAADHDRILYDRPA